MSPKYFLPVCSLCFHSLNSSTQRADVLNFDKVQFTIFLMWLTLLVLQLSNICLTQGHENFLFLQEALQFYIFTFSSINHFEFIFLYGTRYRTSALTISVQHCTRGYGHFDDARKRNTINTLRLEKKK